VFFAVLLAAAAVRSRGSRAVMTRSRDAELTLIIDAGHGGADGGAVSPGGTVESEVNLAIAKKAEAVAAFLGIRAVMTRSSSDIAYSAKATTLRKMKAEDQKARLALITSTPNAVMLSVHQNTFPSPGPYGVQVLYAPTEGSEEWGKNMQLLFANALDVNNRRAAVLIPDSILLMNHIDCPALLVECGFLSNANDEKKLLDDAYRTKLAVILVAGFLREAPGLRAVREAQKG
jgi:N-acetylmuramoyl-L-alanine amidase